MPNKKEHINKIINYEVTTSQIKSVIPVWLVEVIAEDLFINEGSGRAVWQLTTFTLFVGDKDYIGITVLNDAAGMG